MSFQRSRRHFLKHGSAVTLASAFSAGFITRAWAQTDAAPRFVEAATTHGRLRGFEAANGIKTFRGIPYGASTAGTICTSRPESTNGRRSR